MSLINLPHAIAGIRIVSYACRLSEQDEQVNFHHVRVLKTRQIRSAQIRIVFFCSVICMSPVTEIQLNKLRARFPA